MLRVREHSKADRRLHDPDWLAEALARPHRSFEKIPKFPSFATVATAERAVTFEMESTAAETKVQIRLSTRDPGLQIAEEPTVLLVQTCK